MADETAELTEWIKKAGMLRHLEALTDDNGDFGFKSLDDLRELDEGEAQEIVKTLHMNIGEKKRFLRELKQLQPPVDDGAPPQAPQGAAEVAGHAQSDRGQDSQRAAAKEEQASEVEALRRELQRQREEAEEQRRQVQRQRERAEEQQRQNELLEQQRRQEQEEVERRREAERLEQLRQEEEQRKQQELLQQQQELLEKKRQEQLELQRELERLERQKQQQKHQQQQLLLQQQQQLLQDSMLQQPDHQAELMRAPGLALEWFCVLKSMIFVKATPHKDAETLATVPQGEHLQVHCRRHPDDDANHWAELTAWELQRRGGGKPPTRGFVLIDGTAMGLGRLLAGPLEVEAAVAAGAVTKAQQKEEGGEEEDEEEEEEGEEGKDVQPPPSKEQTFAANWVAEEARLKELWGPDAQLPLAEQLPRGLKVMQAVHDFIYVRRSSDPSVGSILRIACKPSASFLSTGAKWTGPAGGEWVEQYLPRGAAQWLLVEGPGFQVDGPMLLDEGAAEDHIRVSVTYHAPRGPVCLLRTFISRHATAQKLCSRLCSATGLSPKAAMLAPRVPREAIRERDPRMPGNPVMSSQVMLPHETLASHGLQDEAEVHLAYSVSFEEDYQGGLLLRE